MERKRLVKEPMLAAIRRALRQPLPGLSAQLRMAPRPRPLSPPAGHQPREGGVLILLYPKDGALYLPLIRRSDTVEYHKGQISLPGGARERGESLEQTALRETHEELGIAPSSLQVLGALTPLYVYASDYCISPYVAYSSVPPVYTPDPIEVAEVLEVSLAVLSDPRTRREEVWTIRGLPMTVPFYSINGHKVWGATAMVLSELVAVVGASTPT